MTFWWPASRAALKLEVAALQASLAQLKQEIENMDLSTIQATVAKLKTDVSAFVTRE